MANSDTHLATHHDSSALNDVKYRYALDENQCVIEISSDSVIKSKDYVCVSCGKILRPVKGPIRKKHFRHKVHVDCSSETYLHNLAKLVFKQTYDECLDNNRPYIFEYKVPKCCDFCPDNGPCIVGEAVKQIDLTRYFQHVALEVRDNEFIPDLLLTASNKQRLYVEIAVTHFVEEKKVASGMKILEIHIDNEGDIDLITSCLLSEEDARINIHNFRKDPVSGNFSSKCKKTVDCFILYPSGKSIMCPVPLLEFKKIGSKDCYVETIDKSGQCSNRDEFVERVGKAFKKGMKIKNCWLCTFHCLQFRTQESFCRLHKTEIMKTNHAVECKKYKPIKSVPECGLVTAAVNQAAESHTKWLEQQQAKRNASPPPPPPPSGKQKAEPYPFLEMKAAGFLDSPEDDRKLSSDEIKRIVDNASDPFLDIIFYGVKVNCAGCGSELMLVTSAKVIKCSVRIDAWDFIQSNGEFYKSIFLNKVLEATACEENKPFNLVCRYLARYSMSKVLAVQCPSCSEISPLTSCTPGQIFQRKMHHKIYSQIILDGPVPKA